MNINYYDLPVDTTTGCPRRLDGEHEFIWAKRIGMQECKLCGAKNWVGMDDPRAFPITDQPAFK